MRSDGLQSIIERAAPALEVSSLAARLTEGSVTEAGASAALLWLREASASDDREGASGAPPAASKEDARPPVVLVARSGVELTSRDTHVIEALATGPVALVFDTGVALTSNSLLTDRRVPEKRWLTRHGLRACAVLPLNARGVTDGALALFFDSPLSEEEARRLTRFAEEVGVLLTHARQADALRRRIDRLERENLCLRREILDAQPFEQMLGTSVAVRALRERLETVAGSASPVLIVGPTGAGKELLARTIHARSPRAAGAILKTRCAELTETAMRAELFGHEGETFCCADTCRLGRLELAQGGSLLLQRIDRMPSPMQIELHEVVRSGRFTRVGGQQPQAVDVRLMASSTRDLAEAARLGEFREALADDFRSHVLTVPALRDRPEDIPLLVEHYVRRFSRQYLKEVAPPNAATMCRLTSHTWPGNIRELCQVIEHAVLRSTNGSLHVEPLSETATTDVAASPADESLVAVERAHIIRVLQRCDGVIEGTTGAASVLGMKPSTLRSRMAKLGISRRPPPAGCA